MCYYDVGRPTSQPFQFQTAVTFRSAVARIEFDETDISIVFARRFKYVVKRAPLQTDIFMSFDSSRSPVNTPLSIDLTSRV